jgi:hypothetical protein
LKFASTAAVKLFPLATFSFPKSEHFAKCYNKLKFAKKYAFYQLEKLLQFLRFSTLVPNYKASSHNLHVYVTRHQTPQSCDLVYYKFVEWMQASHMALAYNTSCLAAQFFNQSRASQVDIVRMFASSLNTSPWCVIRT